jgi:VWFA-related protein
MRKIGLRVGAYTATAVVTFTIGAALLASQTPTATEQTTVQPVADPVSLDLAVRDRHNKPVLDLKPEELKVADNGKPAKVTGLRLMDGRQQDGPLITLVFDRPGMEDNKKVTEDSLFGATASAARDTSKRLRQEAKRFVSSIPDGEYRFAVVDTWGRLQIQQEFSENREATEESVLTAVQPAVIGAPVEANSLERRVVQEAKTGQNSSGAVLSVQDRALARSMYTAMQTSSRIGKDQHLSVSQACLLALVEAQQSLPGRKAIVYFTSIAKGNDDPFYRIASDNHAKDGFKAIAGAANRAGVSIYVVLPDALQDPNDNDFMSGVSSADQAGGIGQLNAGPLAGQTPMSFQTQLLNSDLQEGTKAVSKTTLFSQDNIILLTQQTGGDVLVGNSPMTGQVKDLVRGLTSYYEASFVPSSGEEDGSFHATAFKISRKGLKMSARAGYLAMPPSAGITDPVQPFEVPLLAMLKLQQLPVDVDYRARVMQMKKLDEGNVGLLAMEVPMSGVGVRTDASTHLNSAHVSVLATITDSAGTEMERFSEDIVRRWPAGDSAGTAPQIITFERSFAAPPGTYVLETAILDNNGGKAAAKRQTFEIPATQTMPELSDLMIVRGIELPDNGNSETDLLWRGERQVLPNLYGELPSGTHKVSVFFLAHTDPKSQAPATVKLEVLRDGEPLKGAPLTSTIKAGDEYSPVLKAFSVTSAANGKYEFRVTLVQGDKSAEKTGEFVLAGEEEQIASGAAPTGDRPIAGDPPGLAAAEPTSERPTPEEQERILADARKSALDYGNGLPNLICRQTTQRLFDMDGKGDWELEDMFVDVLTYVNHEENRTLVGTRNSGAMPDSKISMSSSGEFGASLANIFRPESKAKFTWEETDTLRGEQAEVFDYRVERENSALQLTGPDAGAMASYHGRIYIDRATHGVMSLTMITDEQPKKFYIRKAAIRVDYDYVSINDHDYLLPISAQVVTKVGSDFLKRNDLTFSDFRKFGSTARIVGAQTAEGPK